MKRKSERRPSVIKIGIIFLSIVTICGCAKEKDNTADQFPHDSGIPEKDAMFYIKREDTSLRGVRSYDIGVPGISAPYDELIKKYEINVVPGTSDIQFGTNDHYQDDMTKYAERYNRFMFSWMGCDPSHPMDRCTKYDPFLHAKVGPRT
jgi:hypothetical protein